MRQYFPQPPSNADLYGRQGQLNVAQKYAPSGQEQAIGGILNLGTSILDFARGQQVLKQQKEMNAQKQNLAVVDDLINKGYTFEPPEDQYGGIGPPKPVRGVRDEITQGVDMGNWKPPQQKPKRDFSYTDTTLVRMGEGKWGKQRNVYYPEINKTQTTVTPLEGVPAPVLARMDRLREEEGNLTDIERGELATLRNGVKQFTNPYTKEVNYAAYNAWLDAQKKSPKVKKIALTENSPIVESDETAEQIAERILGGQ